jgi:putative peptidoglycan lipid II flippase
MGIIILFSKILGLVRDMMIAGEFGTTAAAVAYETASKLPVTIFDFVLGGVVTAAFIPVYNNLAVKRGKKDALSFAQSYFNLIILVTVCLSVIGVVFSPALVSFIAPDLSAETANLAASLTRIMFPMVIFVGAAFSFVGFLQSEGEYNIPAIISLVSNLIMVAYLVFLSDKFGVYGLSVAMLIGWGAQAAVQLPSAFKRGFRFKLNAPLLTPEIGRALGNTLPILIATWTVPVCSLINTRLASGIDSGRAINALGYANRLYIIIVGLFSFVATNLIFPKISRAAAGGDTAEGERLTRVSMKTLVFIIAPISAGVAVLASPFISLIYERGEFTAADTLLTAEAMRFYAAGMIFQALSEVLTKSFFAHEKNRLPMISSIISMCVNVGAVLILGDRLGVGGIALITSISSAVNMVTNLIFAYRCRIITAHAADYVDIAKSVAMALVMAASVDFAYRQLSALPQIAAFGIAVLAGVIVYGALALILRSEAVCGLIGVLKNRKNNKSM